MFGKESIGPALMIGQAEPFASLHSLNESRQHAFRPDHRFGTTRVKAFFGLFSLSLSRHSCRWVFRCSVLHASTFLRSLRSTGITPLPHYYGRSDSCSA